VHRELQKYGQWNLLSWDYFHQVPNYQEYQIWNRIVTVPLIVFVHDSSGFLTDGRSACSLLPFTSPKGVVHNYLIHGYCIGFFPERHFNRSCIYLLSYVLDVTFTQMYDRGFLNKSSEKWVVF
jgi:hypothetical protein